MPTLPENEYGGSAQYGVARYGARFDMQPSAALTLTYTNLDVHEVAITFSGAAASMAFSPEGRMIMHLGSLGDPSDGMQAEIVASMSAGNAMNLGFTAAFSGEASGNFSASVLSVSFTGDQDASRVLTIEAPLSRTLTFSAPSSRTLTVI